MKAQSASASVQLARRLGFARAMRSEPTASERVLWAELAGSKLGVGFRRQAVVAGCIVDFLAASRKLVVEVDGGYHRTAARRRADARRDRRLERAGFRVLRLPAELVLSNVQGRFSTFSARSSQRASHLGAREGQTPLPTQGSRTPCPPSEPGSRESRCLAPPTCPHAS